MGPERLLPQHMGLLLLEKMAAGRQSVAALAYSGLKVLVWALFNPTTVQCSMRTLCADEEVRGRPILSPQVVIDG